MTEQTTFAPTETPQIEDFKSHYVGEGKKYSTEADAFKGLHNANGHIKTLESELAEVRQELAVRASVEEILKANVPNSQPPVEQTPSTPVEPTSPVGQVADPKELSDLVREVLAQDQAASQREENFRTALAAMNKIFGSADATNQAVNKRAQELGISVDLLKQVAEKSPAAFYVNMGVDVSATSTNTAPASSDVSTPVFTQTQNATKVQPGTYAYYEEIRKTDPSRYATLAKEMNAKAFEDPDKFFGRK